MPDDLPVRTDTPGLPTSAVFAQAGAVLTNSRTVAEVFGKKHGHVMRQIRSLIAAEPELRGSSFGPTQSEVPMPTGGTRLEPSYDIDRTGLTLLAMGFTGERALRWKLLYIAAFDRMEAELRAQAAPAARINVRDPHYLLQLSAELTQELQASQGKVAALEADIAALAPKAAAWTRLADASGAILISSFAKQAGFGINWLADFLVEIRWCFRRADDKRHDGRKPPLTAYQRTLERGLMIHRLVEITRGDGSTWSHDQVRLTPRGAAELAKLLQSRRAA